jgi:hypothetical protein
MPVDPKRAEKNGSANQKTNDIKEKLWAKTSVSIQTTLLI